MCLYPHRGMNTKYTRELLAPLVANSTSVAQILRKLSKPQLGSIHTHVSKVIRRLGLDTSHFTGRATNAGDQHQGGPGMSNWADVLVLQETRTKREAAFRLRRALIQSGVPYTCAVCNQDPVWNGQELRLQVDHINGNWKDNRPGNLRFLCPNCHSQTPTHSGTKGGTSVTSDAGACRRRRQAHQKRGSGEMVDTSV